MMQRISWSSPADILERIIRYEAVHMIQDGTTSAGGSNRPIVGVMLFPILTGRRTIDIR